MKFQITDAHLYFIVILFYFNINIINSNTHEVGGYFDVCYDNKNIGKTKIKNLK